MSKYTTEVRFICESYAGLSDSVGLTNVNTVLQNSVDKVFDFDFPIFDENYRRPLEIKILKHFYTREICAETVGLWKLWLNDKLNVIMPYYNQLYSSALLEFNPLYDVNLTRKHQGKNNTSSQSNTNGESSSKNSGDRWNYFSDTPQGGIQGIEELNYLTNATHDTDENSGESKSVSNASGQVNSVDEYLETVQGKQGTGSYSGMLLEYRKTFLNIDEMVLKDLDELFMQLW